tara:strand:- start:62418 stop:64154 length:1737 start_codon:yes stop_codon:yes gene_type:complete
MINKVTGVNEISELTGKLHWFHWGIFSLSLILTFSAWYYSKSLEQEKIQGQFLREANKTIEQITERMEMYEGVLWSGAGLFDASESVSKKEWTRFARTISIDTKYPGINGIGVIFYNTHETVNEFLKNQRLDNPDFKIHPAHKQSVYLPITFIEPLSGNEAAVGLDMGHEKNRFDAAIKAKESGKATITGPITLVQDSEKKPGFLFFVPFYDADKNQNSDGVMKNFKGLIYAPFVVNKLMDGTLSSKDRHVGVNIRDGDSLIYFENTNMKYDPNPLFQKTLSIDFYGRVWDFELYSDMEFRVNAQSKQPLTILLGGLTIDFMILLLFFMLSRSNKKAVSYAKAITYDLSEKALKLEKSNKELEQFAYVTSHDLKAPLRGIENIVTWIEEDSIHLLDRNSKEHFAKLKIRVDRMNNLIKGILEYSKVGFMDRTDLEEIQTLSIIKDIKEQYCSDDKIKIQVNTKLPAIRGVPLHFKQVLENLISNSVKYNNKEQTIIEISHIYYQNKMEFIIQDNGPGINQQFHSKIFELFHTLHSKDEFESTGVGLSIVKKIIEENGGEIWLESQEGYGTKFYFSWPI